MIKELLHIKYNFAAVPVLDLADSVFTIEALCTEQSFLFLFLHFLCILMYEFCNKYISPQTFPLSYIMTYIFIHQLLVSIYD